MKEGKWFITEVEHIKVKVEKSNNEVIFIELKKKVK
jgi:hypothetical protein